MDPEEAIRIAMKALEANPAVAQYKGLNAALDRLSLAPANVEASKAAPPPAAPSPIANKGGVAKSWTIAASVLPPEGLTFPEFRETYQAAREKPIAEGSFAAQLSKMKKEGLIHKNGDRWLAVRQDNGAGEVSEPKAPAPSVHSNQKGDPDAEKTLAS
ncbi:MAG: hypothetical protein BVN32_11555 [Proteobacteria bacterium ST_bin14]|nr:MAG: hypothetical protein BVN32_11555 [Proteobacteria bacterium ST_bin14]